MRKDLPVPPTLCEPVLQNLPPPPTDPQEFGKWAQRLSELAEQRAELRWQEGRAEGIQVGEEKGRTEGFQAGEEKGIQIGEARGEAKALLVVLRSRGFDIPKEIEHRITECTDPVLLVSWLSRAATIADVSDLLAG